MMKHFLLRLVSIILTLLVVSLIVFLLQAFSLGDSASYILSEDAGGAAADVYRASLSSEKPLILRYFSFLYSFISGNWGKSVTGQDIAEMIRYRAGVTFSLSIFSVLIAIIIGVSVSLLSLRSGSLSDKAATGFSVIILSLPSFLTALFLILFFSMLLGILPPAGYIRPSASVSGWIKSMMLPSLTLALLHASVIIRVFRKALRENIAKPFSFSLYAAGASYQEVILKSALKPSLPVLYTLIASSLASSAAGSAVTETVFALPGLGSLLVTAALSRDSLLSGTLVMLTASAVSIIYAVLEAILVVTDPRARREA